MIMESVGRSGPIATKLETTSKHPQTHPALRPVVQMSRRAAIVEEFDDDTDLPLPSQSLPNTGSRGAILEEIADSGDDDDDGGGGGDSDEAPDLLDPSAVGGPVQQPSVRDTRVTDITPYKKCAPIISKRDGPLPSSYISSSLGGRVFTQFTLTRSDRTRPVLGEFRDPRACGGLSARILRMPALA